MPTYTTPGVYVEEISTLPPSVAQVATAIPAFIGYTEKGDNLPPTRISNMVEYEHFFGGPKKAAYTLNYKAGSTTEIDFDNLQPGDASQYIMHPCLRMYFRNGGGPCYIVSAGSYGDSITRAGLSAALAKLEKVDEPTLIVLTDATALFATPGSYDYYFLCQEVLAQCAKLKDRFGILDVAGEDPMAKVEEFRNYIGTDNLMYGAAYAPHLVTGIPFAYDDDIVTLGFKQIESGITDQNGLQILFDGTGPSVVIRTGDEVAFEVEDNGILNIYLKAPGPTQAAEIKSAWDALPAGAKKGFYINPLGAGGDISEASLTPTKIQGIYLDGTIPSAGSKIQIEYKGNDPSPQVVVNQGAFDIVESGNTLTITLEATTPTTTKISNILAKNTSLTNFEITKVDKSDPLKTPPSGDPNFGYPSAFTGPSQTIPVATLAYEWATGSPDGLKARYEGNAIPTVTIQQSGTPEVEVNGANLTIKNVGPQGVSPASVLEAWNKLGKTNQGQYSIRKSGSGDTVVTTGPAGADRNVPMTSIAATLDIIKDSNTQAYHAIKAKLDQEMMTLPPSSAIAGIYARVDGSRGVWKAPANVSVSNVLGPAEPITDEQQGRLNIDSTSGKSINAIRSFTGKGTLVWGARTLAGNSNEWRYISVRRLFITIEESVQKASAFAVFEPNDATTWLKVKAMIDNYLYGLWQQGALAGPKPESAYYVHVGLGKTMTTQDILEGRMNVEIGVAAVRPAEFIVLKFSHKMQEA